MTHDHDRLEAEFWQRHGTPPIGVPSSRYGAAPYPDRPDLLTCRDCSTRATVRVVDVAEIAEHDAWHASGEEWSAEDGDCLNDLHDHTSEVDAEGRLYDDRSVRPLFCADCGAATHYDEAIEDYVHDDESAPGCFLIPVRPDGASECIR